MGSAGRVGYVFLESYLAFPGISFLESFRMSRPSFDALVAILDAERGDDFWGQQAEGAGPIRHQVRFACVKGI